MGNSIGALLIIGLIAWAFSGTFKGTNEKGSAREGSHLFTYEREAKSSTLLYRFVISTSLLLGISGSLLIGWYFTSLTGNYDFIFYAIGMSLGLVVIYILVKSVINTSENTYISTLLESDLVEVTNKNAALLEALLAISEKEYTTEALNEIGIAEADTDSTAETLENTTDSENKLNEED